MATDLYANKTSSKMRRETAEKVKEIKRRQENWMKPREIVQEKKEKEKNGGSSSQTSIRLKCSERKSQLPTKPENKHSNQKFKSWLKNKNANENSGEDANILVIPEDRLPQCATPDTGWGSENGGLSNRTEYNGQENEYYSASSYWEDDRDKERKLMTPHNFDKIADKIISRVKDDMKETRDDSNVVQYSQHVACDSSMMNITYESHMCPCCHNLMLPSKHSPMLLIPCGHSVCKSCSRTWAKCAICRCGIDSSTSNNVLRRIIEDSHSENDSSTSVVNKGQLAMYANKDQLSKKLNVNHHMHSDTHRNLEIRHSVITEEVQSLQQTIEELDHSMHTTAKQIKNISMKEDSIKAEIGKLENQLSNLQKHRHEYEKDRQDMKTTRAAEQNKLLMAQDTLQSLALELDKVKFLIEGDYS